MSLTDCKAASPQDRAFNNIAVAIKAECRELENRLDLIEGYATTLPASPSTTTKQDVAAR
jgi:hypothetical protein